ncbi:glycosyltransferase family 31 protein [Pisolithus thermaeus]|nr:glycosyltransferase family 31 protein [Pisolithus thermaeus]
MLGFLGISRQAQSSNEAYEFLSTGQEEVNGDTPPWALADNRVSSDIETVLGRSSSESSATPTPFRTSSPPPSCPSHRLSSSISEADGGPTSPLLASQGEAYTFRDGIRNLWHLNPNPRRMRTRERKLWRTLKKGARRIVRHPLFPKQPLTIIFALLLFTLFAISLTLLLMYILNPDKEPLPWQAYCSIPPTTTLPPHLRQTLPYPYINPLPEEIPPSFPPDDLDSLPPAGVFLGVFSTDMSLERRMLIRTTWATHPRSRNGAGTGDDGRGTSRTVVRFILGQPRKGWERRIHTEMEMYNDIVILPCPENMNSGKTHAYFTWAAENAWVPQHTSTAQAPHDSHFAWVEHASGRPRPWVRPDYVAKVDDDAFVMLAELESRMRVELYATGHEPYSRANATTSTPSAGIQLGLEPSGSMVWKEDLNANPAPSLPKDPLVYWGYLVKERFMAGELYGLSWRLVDWVSTSAAVKSYIQGAEDKQTAKWMTIHPQAGEIRWASERCWIYDHPRAGTVYSHGFLFPSHVERIKRSVLSYTEAVSKNYSTSPIQNSVYGLGIPTPPLWSQSSVSTFGVKYQAPLQDMTTAESEEALVEGSEMSRIREGTRADVAYAWRHREGRIGRYLNRRVGGTVVVHFIKKHMWFLETALALLEADDYSDFELESLPKSSRESMNVGLSSVWTDSSAFSHKNGSSIVGLIP